MELIRQFSTENKPKIRQNFGHQTASIPQGDFRKNIKYN